MRSVYAFSIQVAVFLALVLSISIESLEGHERPTGFEVGNLLEAVDIYGDVSVHCRGPRGEQDFARFQCSGQVLDPSTSSRFQTTPGVRANRVELTAYHADGSSRKKKEKFDSSTGRSHGAFNLWIRTLFQRPLLEFGRNTVKYELKNDGRLMRSGTFEVQVVKGRDRRCPFRNITSHNLNDCRAGSNICNQYFSHFNYCK